MKISLRRIAIGVLVGAVGVWLLKIHEERHPSYLRNGRFANESAAVATLRQCALAQKTYQKTDYDSDGVFEHAADLTSLYDWDGPGGADAIRLIDLATAKAHYARPELGGKNGFAGEFAPRSGYYFTELLGMESDFKSPEGGKPPKGWKDGFGLIAIPARFGRTGLHCFVIDDEGMVYETVIDDLDIDHLENLPRYWPDLNAKDSPWFAVGE